MDLDVTSEQYTAAAPWLVKGLAPTLLRLYTLSIAFWMPVSVLVGWQEFALDHAKRLQIPLSTELLIYGVRFFTIALLTPPLFYCVTNWPLSGLNVRRIGLYLGGYMAFSCSFAFIRWTLLPPWVDSMMSLGSPVNPGIARTRLRHICGHTIGIRRDPHRCARVYLFDAHPATRIGAIAITPTPRTE